MLNFSLEGAMSLVVAAKTPPVKEKLKRVKFTEFVFGFFASITDLIKSISFAQALAFIQRRN